MKERAKENLDSADGNSVSSINRQRPSFVWIPSSAPDAFERGLHERLSPFLSRVCRTEQQAIDTIVREGLTVVLFNGPSDQCEPIPLFHRLKAVCPSLCFFLHQARLPTSLAVDLARKGAAGIFGHEADQLTVANEVEAALVRGENSTGRWRGSLIGDSAIVERLCSMIKLVSSRRGTVLLTGESGTGKEVVARAIHDAGDRSAGPFVAVNCGAIPGGLLESELFGHVRGAFTGAHARRLGRFEQAQGGTILLDEIGDMGLDLQSKLLRVLQEREMQRLGSSETVRLDVRVIAATHIDLAQRIREGSFREDLYYRLNVIPIEVPPLRERRGDIPLLADHFLRKICAAERIAVRELAASTRMLLMEYAWPGNIRQLENVLERAVALCGERLLLSPEDFDLPAGRGKIDVEGDSHLLESGFDYERAVNRFEWNLLSQALRRAGGNKKAAADLLGLKRTTLAAKVKVLSTVAGPTIM